MEELDKYFSGELDPKIQYASREQGIKAFAEEYSFNIESELFNQLTKEQQALWRKEIEQAVISGGDEGIELANDKRYDKEEPVSEDLEEAVHKYADGENPTCPCEECLIKTFKAGAKWQKEHLWKPAEGNDLPEIDREVIVLVQEYPDDKDHLRVAFAHRPIRYAKVWNSDLGEEQVVEIEGYDKSGWNIPNVKYWLDCSMPKEIEL